ncbi:MAG: sugar phosphate nucleotidyltransferase [Nocardioidaceae bacterium]
MEAIVIAGGLGSRLRPLTDRRPKHVLPVGGVPFVLHQLTKLAAAGVDSVVLATSYHADAFAPVIGDGSRLGLRVSYVTEAEPMGTGGAIRNAAGELRSGPDDPVVVLNGDQLSGHDLVAQVARFEQSAADVCLHLIEVVDPRPYGCVPTGLDGAVLEFLEKSTDPVSSQVNAGCYVFRRSVIDTIPPGRVVSVERETFPELLRARRRVIGHPDSSYWRDVGTPEALVDASADLVHGIAKSPAYLSRPGERLLQAGAQVADPAGVHGGSVVGDDAVVQAGAVVEGSVLMPRSQVGPGARVVRSVVGPGATVGARTSLHGACVGDDAVVGDDCALGPGVRVACGAVISQGAVWRSAP